MPVGKGLDILQAAPIEHFNARIQGNADGSYAGTEKSDIVIITGGLPRKPGMSREDLVGANQQVIVDVLDKALPLLARCDLYRRDQPARHDDLFGHQALRAAAQPRGRPGRHSRLGAHGGLRCPGP